MSGKNHVNDDNCSNGLGGLKNQMERKQTKLKHPAAKLYSRAFCELVPGGELELAITQLSHLDELIQHDQNLLKVFCSSVFSITDQQKVFAEIKTVIELGPVSRRLIELLITKKRINILGDIVAECRQYADQQNGVVRGVVSSASGLSDDELSTISGLFSRRLGKTVVLEPLLNTNILGGVVVEIDGKTYDGSLSTQLRRLEENLERQLL